ncbi:MAG: septation protein SepH [Pseudonocardia sp.]
MRALRVVGFDGEGDQGVVILEDPDRRERFTVPADERLRAAARGDVQGLGKLSTDLESQLRPREIQARIRAGASVEQVAEAAGVPIQKIERFAYPVLLERSRMSELAQQAHPVREDGPDVRTLGEVVAHTFGLRGQEYGEAEWDAWRGEDNKWVVTLSWKVGRSDITARWGYHPGAHGGTVAALDEHATDLVDGQLSRPPRRVGPVIDFSKPEPEADAAADPDARSATEHRPAAESGPSRAGASGRERAGGSGGSRTGGTRASRPGTRSEVATPAQAAEPAGPQAVDEPAEADTDERPAADAAKRGRKGKPVMPSWEDVLLGVKSQRS